MNVVLLHRVCLATAMGILFHLFILWGQDSLSTRRSQSLIRTVPLWYSLLAVLPEADKSGVHQPHVFEILHMLRTRLTSRGAPAKLAG